MIIASIIATQLAGIALVGWVLMALVNAHNETVEDLNNVLDENAELRARIAQIENA